MRRLGRPISQPWRNSGKPLWASEGGGSALPTLFTVEAGNLNWGYCQMGEEILQGFPKCHWHWTEEDSSITRAQLTEVVWMILDGKAPEVDEIRPEYLKSMDVVGLSCLTFHCNMNAKLQSGTCVLWTQRSHSTVSLLAFWGNVCSVEPFSAKCEMA